MIIYFFIFALSDEKSEPLNLAEYYLNHLDLVDTPVKRNEAILKCLGEIAQIIDKEATKKTFIEEIQYNFQPYVSSVDSRDRDLKKKFQKLQTDVRDLQSEVDSLINQTDVSLHAAMKKMRKEIISSFKEIILYAQSVNDNNVDQVVKNVDDSIARQKTNSSSQAIVFFILIQVILSISFYIALRYIRNLSL